MFVHIPRGVDFPILEVVDVLRKHDLELHAVSFDVIEIRKIRGPRACHVDPYAGQLLTGLIKHVDTRTD